MSELKPCELVHIFEHSRLVSNNFTAEAVTAAYVAALAALRAQPANEANSIEIGAIKNEPLTCEGCADFDAADDDYVYCQMCKRLTRVNDYYRRKPERSEDDAKL